MKIGWFEDIHVLNESPVNFCGVYAIVNGATSMAYVGSSASVASRFSAHKRHLNDHMREGLSHSNRALQDDWDVYGEDIFDFVLLEACPPGMLLAREQRWFDFFGMQNLYNTRKANDPTGAIDAELAADVRELKESGHSTKEISILLKIEERQIYNVMEKVMNSSSGFEPVSPKKHELWGAERFATCDRTVNN